MIAPRGGFSLFIEVENILFIVKGNNQFNHHVCYFLLVLQQITTIFLA